MEPYKHVLLAVDFFEQDELVISKAQQIAEQFQAKLSLIHVVDSMPVTDAGYGSDIPYNLDLTAELIAVGKLKVAKLADSLAIPEERRWLEMGSPKLEIVRVADENQVDLIVVGSHGRHGLALLLGSTANGVLHHAKCDVLAVCLQDQ
jgi:universal stress protein A